MSCRPTLRTDLLLFLLGEAKHNLPTGVLTKLRKNGSRDRAPLNNKARTPEGIEPFKLNSIKIDGCDAKFAIKHGEFRCNEWIHCISVVDMD